MKIRGPLPKKYGSGRLLGRLRDRVRDEVAADSALTRDLEAKLFSYVDPLAASRA